MLESCFNPDLSPLNTRSHIINLIVVLITALVLIPLVQLGQDWYEIHKYESAAGISIVPSAAGSDWIEWSDESGSITARYVFPHGPGAAAGIEPGDRFYMLEYQQYFDTRGLGTAIEGSRPGETLVYLITRDGETMERRVKMTRHPTFMYPRSNALWRFTLWGFTLGAFFHVLGLFIAGPLAAHSKKARFEFLLIAVSSMWIIGNLLRLLAVELFGPPSAGTTYDTIFQALTVVGLTGWIGFPFLLLRKVVSGTRDSIISRVVSTLLWVTPVILVATFGYIASVGHLGPILLDDLLVPIVFYASCYIGGAALLVFLSNVWLDKTADTFLTTWGKTGSLLILLTTTVIALSVKGIVPTLGSLDVTLSAWFIVAAQLLAIVPITLSTVKTLRLGKVDEVLTRTFVYVFVLGTLFIAFVGGLALIESTIERTGASRGVIEGLYVVLLLILFERGARRLRVFAASFFTSDRHRMRERLGKFQTELTDFVDAKTLAERTVTLLGSVFNASSAVLFLPSPDELSGWVTARYDPNPPYFTERVFLGIWPYFQEDSSIWAANPELNENMLPAESSQLMQDHGAALALPIRRHGVSSGLLILGPKSTRRGTYNLEDIELLRSLSGPLALGVDRLALIERERQLATENTNAKLVALRAQINPHFLFNALNTILALIGEKPEEAERVVEDLASIFRRTLLIGSKPFVDLADEIALVERYLRIEKARFGERLVAKCKIDPSLASFPVPAFVVQTITENAVKHGLEKRRTRGTLLISCTPRQDGSAQIDIEDSGVGIPALFGKLEFTLGASSFFGIGLNNVCSRLEKLYGRNDLLQMRSNAETGTHVRVILPPVHSREQMGNGAAWSADNQVASYSHPSVQ